MRQQTLASRAGFEKFGRKGQRKLFLDQTEQWAPWPEFWVLVEPPYPKAGSGRQPVGLAIKLRTYFLKQRFNLSGPGMEKTFYEVLDSKKK
jgi:transposase, IS5 family